MADLLEARAEELGRIQVREMGVLPAGAGWQTRVGASAQFRFFADYGAQFLADEPIDLPGARATVVKRPLGVILGIIPWNAPNLLIARFTAPNLILGNTVLLKPAPQCPESAAAMRDLMLDAESPKACSRWCTRATTRPS